MRAYMVDIERAKASVVMWLIRSHMGDIRAYLDGDASRFSRMVVDGGRTPRNASPSGWAEMVVRNLGDPLVATYYADEAVRITEELKEQGYIVGGHE